MKRSNGAGSVYKLSGHRRKPWVAVITMGYDNDNKAVRKPVAYCATKAEAEIRLGQYHAMPTSEDHDITLQALFEKWKTTRAFTDLEKTTQAGYNTAFNYFKTLYKTKFAALRTCHFQKAIDLASEMGRSHSTMQKIRVLCGILSEYALAEDIVHKTYYSTLRVPRERAKKEVPTFSELERAKLFKNDTDTIVQTILILIYTGMRISELLGLLKANVDLDNMLIVGGVKTEAGRDRIIPIHTKIQSYVAQMYANAEKYLVEHDKEVGNKKRNNLRTVRKPYRYEYYCDLYYAVLDRLGIRRLTPHKARHTFFTRLSENCKDRKGMALVGGHTDPGFTEKVYDQPSIERLRKVIETL